MVQATELIPPIRHKVLMPLLHQNQPRCAFSLIAFKSVDTDDDPNAYFLYEPLEGLERKKYYRPGGYHPIQIGERFHGRDRVVYRLGHGLIRLRGWPVMNNQ